MSGFLSGLTSKISNIGSSADGSSGSSSGSGSGSSSGGFFSNFYNLTFQKMVLLLAIIAFFISVSSIAILLWNSKNSQKWPPEIASCPDRWKRNGANCNNPYNITSAPSLSQGATDSANYTAIKSLTMGGGMYSFASDNNYVPWEGINDGKDQPNPNIKI